MGDLLFSVVNLARFRKVDPEILMTAANNKFENRFGEMERILKNKNLTLEAATPALVAPLRTVRLESDAAEADAKVAGSPLWRRAEPGEDAALAAALAADLAAWTKQCAAS